MERGRNLFENSGSDQRYAERGRLHRGNVSRFQAGVGGYFGNSYKVFVDLQSGGFAYTHLSDDISGVGEVTDAKSALSDGEITRLFHLLERSDFINWKERYDDVLIMDGTQWWVEVELKDGTKITKSGSNAYPRQWAYFCENLSELAGGPFH